ncbi:NADPH:quinone oxidoreductase family protein [Pseudonocardia sp. HH130630-07]|uniref:NADPH:quinone oxidoreductase family protein n=1 Tax=Pseudonocardia sp. HH130630-07 TaxID=1690815 RepID=UPI000814CADB|nr:NADPH:quinone oxidoreductase family protein [Pseudonocardia sp. HH130630-07]ANY05248.1 NADPH:quinone oxidoreductase [Pseudonocardia sp. HH130630-07]
MRAVQVVELEGPSAVRLNEVDPPVRGDGEVLVDVAAAGVNFPDVLMTRGLYQIRPEPPFVLGSECAGTVREAGPDSGLAPGDRVAAFALSGMFGEIVSVPEGSVLPLPDEVGFAAGACLPMNYLTAHFTLVTRGGLQPGETVLVHGAAGGIGTAVIQLAAALGATVIGVTSTEAKAEVARRAGAAHAVGVEGFKDAVRELTGGAGVDMVVDPVGGDRFTDSLRSLAPLGRVMVVGFTAGEIPTVKVNRLLLGNTDVRGVGWGAYALDRDGFTRAGWDALLPHLRSGALDPVVSERFALDEAPTALARIDERTVTGKVVLQM